MPLPVLGLGTRNNKPEIDARADLYSAGIVLYEALNGSNPYLVGKRDQLEVIRHAGSPQGLVT